MYACCKVQKFVRMQFCNLQFLIHSIRESVTFCVLPQNIGHIAYSYQTNHIAEMLIHSQFHPKTKARTQKQYA